MSAYKISELKSKHAITRIRTFFLNDNWNDASDLIKLSDVLLKEFDIKGKDLHNLQLDQLSTSRIPTMDLPEITDENGK